MIEQVGCALTFYAFFTAAKTGKTGLAPAVDVYKCAGGATSLAATDAAAAEIGGGLYAFTLAAASVDAEGEYLALFKTADATVDQQHIPALWAVGRAGIERLDAAVSSRATAGQVDAQLSASHGAGPWDASGAGSQAFTYTLTSEAGGAPIGDARVWVTTDAAGSNVVASGTTDQNGCAVFHLGAGTIYVWRAKTGWEFVNPDVEVVA